ncbi:uncharacterized protein J4E84_010685 [Alternaria hordeiaustralica]|uniref:uncharacterized protein n=1 Tax=Alternaria hordeiaustralica TaxID=1187925 RepID=UPI0020C251D1|nr:uncharacterized protein J4E84_010685 [Alternaria hordeiaustralica]KAI4674310.1 hypothetical protein J4E84_010685 [Alternaria hordeiaustralica]
MEAIGLVASIITLISAASNAALILERVLGLRGVSLYVLGALNEVTDFKATSTLMKLSISFRRPIGRNTTGFWIEHWAVWTPSRSTSEEMSYVSEKK